MDYFFAQVEERDDPTLKNQPFSVGSIHPARGVISTCNYIARKYGIHSAMPVALAIKKCPQLILLPTQMHKYKEASKIIRKIFYHLTPLVEPLSLDEAYLDVSKITQFSNSATWMAKWLLNEIYEKTGLTASAGIASNKLLAKIASDVNKPNGMYVVKPEMQLAFISNLPIHRLYGVGKVTQQKLYDMNVHYCKDLQAFSKTQLTDKFGKFGNQLYDFCRGEDHRPISTGREIHSVSTEHTYLQDLTTEEACLQELPHLHKALLKRIKVEYQTKISGIFIKITDHQFHKYSIERKSTHYNLTLYQLLFKSLYEKKHAAPIRLIGLGIRLNKSNIEEIPVQLNIIL